MINTLREKENTMSLFAQQVTNYWCRTKGIHSKDLDTHPQIDDVMLLLKYRDSMWDILAANQKAYWGSIWGRTYNYKLPLRNQHLQALERITIKAFETRQQVEAKKAIARIKIKQLRPV
jgi:hypothetical protein